LFLFFALGGRALFVYQTAAEGSCKAAVGIVVVIAAATIVLVVRAVRTRVHGSLRLAGVHRILIAIVLRLLLSGRHVKYLKY
jgi:hypothetical protein